VTHPQYLDTLGLWEATAGFPEQLLAAAAASTEVLDHAALPDPGHLRSVALFGMGTSGTAADAVAAYGAGFSSRPIWVGKGYDAPSFVGPDTLVFALSFDGDTEETVAAAAAAAEKGAVVVVVSGGGALSKLATASGLTRFEVPPGLPAARTALGALAVPALLTLSRLGLVADVGPSLERALVALRRRRDALVAPGGPAEEVARLIGRTIPLIYGSSGLNAVAAWRWKTQVNENAKTPAFWSVQPELCHNEIAGWGQHGDVTRQVLSLVTLRHAGEHPQVARRFGLTVDATDEVMANVIAVWAEGEDDLSRFLDLTLFGDFVSLHMAGRESIDPGPVPALSDVASALRGRP
jgi:glucose/mannose-6-phosphate isomerase